MLKGLSLPGGPGGGRTIRGTIIQLNNQPQSGADERVFIKFAIWKRDVTTNSRAWNVEFRKLINNNNVFSITWHVISDLEILQILF